MKPETVSVVMSTYNGAVYVAEQVESILQQTYTALEIIIADDASTDNTYSILKSFTEKDNRIVLYRNEKNLGYNISFSQACAKATGAFIAISDQDDVWELNKIEKQVQKIKEDKNTVLVHCISARFEEKSKPHLRSIKKMNFFRGSNIKSFYLANYVLGHAMLFKRSLLEASLPFPPNVYYDWWLAAYACVIGKIDFVNEILVWHRMHQTNATGAAKPKMKFYEQQQSILSALLNIKGINADDKRLVEKLLSLYQHLPAKTFSPSLFFFLLAHSKAIFAHKKRWFPWISYIKHSFKYSLRSTIA